jgi:hypothetical protein
MSLLEPDYDAVIATLMERSYEDLERSMAMYATAIRKKRLREEEEEQIRRKEWLKANPLEIKLSEPAELGYFHGERGDISTTLNEGTMTEITKLTGRIPGPMDNWTIRWLGRDHDDDSPSANWFRLFIRPVPGNRIYEGYLSHCPVDIACPMYLTWMNHLRNTDPVSHEHITEAMSKLSMEVVKGGLTFSMLVQRAAQQEIYRWAETVEFIPTPIQIYDTLRHVAEITVPGIK